LFGLSRSTRCGCCSNQVSSISVRRVTRYDLYANRCDYSSSSSSFFLPSKVCSTHFSEIP
jgi:hypothetical protein